MDYIQMIQAILFGVISGCMLGALGYVKSEKMEEINPVKFVQTLVLGAIVGAFAGMTGLDFGSAESTFYMLVETMGLTAVFDFAVKTISRRIVKRFGPWLKKGDSGDSEEDSKDEEE